MDNQGWAEVPRAERPAPEELEGYIESRFDPEPDYSMYRREKHLWLYDYRRDQELKRSDGATPLMGHGNERYEQRHGYDETEFLKNAAKIIKSRSLH